jgi:uncharacterized protein (DUF1330 family)
MKSSTMTSTEVDEYMEKIDQLSQTYGGKSDIKQLKEFFDSDDGEAFYTVNLYKYHDEVRSMTSDVNTLSGREVYDRFSNVMIKLLLKNYSYPIFGSNWLDLSDNGWDRIVIVRYRSRKDMAEIYSDPKFVLASVDKWSSLKAHERFVVKALHLPEIHMLFFLFICILMTIFLSKKSIVKKNRTRD